MMGAPPSVRMERRGAATCRLVSPISACGGASGEVRAGPASRNKPRCPSTPPLLLPCFHSGTALCVSQLPPPFLPFCGMHARAVHKGAVCRAENGQSVAIRVPRTPQLA